MARPVFDDPEDEGLYGSGPAAPMATGSGVVGSDYGEASVPTMEDYANPALAQIRRDQAAAEQLAAAARASQQQLTDAAILAQDPEYRANVSAARAQAEAAGIRDGIYERTPVRKVARPGHVPTKRLTDTLGTTEDPGLVAEGAQAVKEVGAATVQNAVATTSALQDLANQQRAAQIDMQASALARSEQIKQARGKVDATNAQVAKMASEFAKSSEVDPGRWWASRSAGQKFAAILSAALLGFAGMDPFAHLQAAVREDIDAQRANIDLRRAKLGAAENVAGRQRFALDDLRAELQDDSLAENALYMARLEQFKAEFTAKLSEAGHGVVTAEHKALINTIDQELAKKHYENEMTAEANTPMITVGGGYALSAEERADRRKRASAADERAAKAEERGGDVLESREKIQMTTAADVEKERAKAAMSAGQPSDTDKRLAHAQRELVVKETRKRREELRQLTNFREKYADEVPGFVWGVGWTRPKPGEINPLWGDAEEAAYQELKRPIMIRLRQESGAAIGAREEAKDSPYGGGGERAGMTLEEASAQADEILGAHNTEEALMAEVNRRIEEAQHDIDWVERAVEEPINEEVNRSRAAPRASRATGGTGLPSVVEWEE